MPESHAASLAVSRAILRLLIKLNWLGGLFILAILIASLVAARPLFEALGFNVHAGNRLLIPGGRIIVVLGLVAIPVTHVVLARLLAIVNTVSQGDPFISDNAKRLQTIGWAVLGLELLHLLIGIVAAAASTAAAPLDINWSFSLTRWIAVLLLFVLARVFEQGARMRDELEGTV